jgi:hypothetical protein
MSICLLSALDAVQILTDIMGLTSGQSYKTFWSKFTHSFCKLDRFIIEHYFLGALKWSSKNRGSNYTPKCLHRIGSRR